MAESRQFRHGVFVATGERKIVMSGEVNIDMEEEICRAMCFFDDQSGREVLLFIDSTGGRQQAGQHLFGLIWASPFPVTGVVMTKAHSAAFHILQGCQKRVAYPHADILNHGTELRGFRIDQPGLLERIKELKQKEAEFLDYLVTRSKVSLKQLREWSRNETVLSAEQALEAGLIDEIYTPR